MHIQINKKCLICNSEVFSALLRESRFKKLDAVPDQYIVRCNGCRTVTRSPSLFSPEFNDSIAVNVREESEFIGGGTESIAAHIKERLALAENLVSAKTILDIGCGSGALLVYAKNQGWEIYGTERGSLSIEKLKRYNIPCFTGDLSDPEFQKMKFDVVHMNHVLEHVEDPLRTLNDLSGLVKNDGRIIIEVPNELSSLTQRIRQILKWDGSSQTSYFQHEWFFSPKTMLGLCERSGLKIDSLTTPFRESASLLVNAVRFIAAKSKIGEVIEVHLSKRL